MKKIIAISATVLLSLAGSVTAASAEGNAYGATARDCFASYGNLGQVIQEGKMAHPGVKMTAKTLAESAHCA